MYFIYISVYFIYQRRQWRPNSSTLAWKIPWMEEPGRLQSMGLLSRTQLSDFSFTFHFHALEKEMATHSSVLAWRIPGMGEPDGLPSMGLRRVGHNWSNSAAAAYFIYINSDWQTLKCWIYICLSIRIYKIQGLQLDANIQIYWAHFMCENGKPSCRCWIS